MDDKAAAQAISRITRGWSPQRKTALAKYAAAQHARKKILHQHAHPAELAQSIDPTYIITPAIELISKSVERALREPGRNLLISCPPQEGKSSLCAVWAPLRALQHNPDTRIMLATYADSLAEEHSATARDLIRAHGVGARDSVTGSLLEDKLGLAVRQDRSAMSRWRIVGAQGGMTAAGISSGITGRPGDLLIIDDPYKNMQEADSPAHREKVRNFWRATARTRLSPSASVILIMTRWHPDDLAATILDDDHAKPSRLRSWRYINIPAVSEPGIPDALARPPGVAMISARGRTAEQFAETRATVGERVWYALYCGVPAPPEGGLFQRAWFARHRVSLLPARPVVTVVGVDPAETGHGDEAGIIAGSVFAGGHIVLTHDRSGQLTSEGWAREAVRLAVEVGASELAVEGYVAATTYERIIRAAYKGLRIDHNRPRDNPQAVHDKPLAFMDSLLPERPPFRIHVWRGRGDPISRSAGLRQGMETGRVRVFGQDLAEFEARAVAWQPGQHQPDRVAAAIIADDRLTTLARSQPSIASPVSAGDKGLSPAHSWLARRVG